jgi:hypothetical protein
MMIFMFLRILWATIIPIITVPRALLRTCALMCLVGYSLDNLSLMALTIASRSSLTMPSSRKTPAQGLAAFLFQCRFHDSCRLS